MTIVTDDGFLNDSFAGGVRTAATWISLGEMYKNMKQGGSGPAPADAK